MYTKSQKERKQGERKGEKKVPAESIGLGDYSDVRKRPTKDHILTEESLSDWETHDIISELQSQEEGEEEPLGKGGSESDLKYDV